jgi:hypothetical protein
MIVMNDWVKGFLKRIREEESSSKRNREEEEDGFSPKKKRAVDWKNPAALSSSHEDVPLGAWTSPPESP